ncbi:probable peroxidase 61 [Dioscorea cayenensis subsp. rotundata]|uniref:Peroxidase n=1 Tax=Dioscorea cayennensis subsp. rotundata TaxID=55577 RepID=A0AB40B4N3_DIOCR|nr:probable peroxidase 61 [Dioscorea cayenensis subsp. rotundata]
MSNFRKGSFGLLMLLLLLSILATLVVVDAGISVPINGLMIHYYEKNTTCKSAEYLVKLEVKKMWDLDHSITPALLRLAYSDCLVTGCDASILLDGKGSEKTAPQNSGLRGFAVIDRIKKILEDKCPGIVSCADILQLATKEAAALAGAPKYPVYTGRKDGMKSNASTVDLPPPSISWNKALAYFKLKGLDVLDLGTLLGAHTTGVTHCRYIVDRLYNFKNTKKPDPSMNSTLLNQLRKSCPRTTKPGQVQDPVVFLNPETNSNYSFTNSYYQRVLDHNAVLGIDQSFLSSTDGFRIAYEFANGFQDFKLSFSLAIDRMASLGVLTGDKGEIRRNCRFINADNPGNFSN